jgi:predicted Zn-dependent peptidase
MGYHTPAIDHSDNAVFEAISDILGAGRTSRLYKSLVKEKKIAVNASAFQGFPGSKYPGLFVFFATPSQGHTTQESEEAVVTEIERLKTEPVSDQDLEKFRTRSQASVVRALASNRGLARQLTFYEVVTGDWRNLFKQLDEINQVTAQDIQRVAKEYFTSKNSVVGVIETQQSDR